MRWMVYPALSMTCKLNIPEASLCRKEKNNSGRKANATRLEPRSHQALLNWNRQRANEEFGVMWMLNEKIPPAQPGQNSRTRTFNTLRLFSNGALKSVMGSGSVLRLV